MDFSTGAGLLHRLTSYSPERPWYLPADDARLRHDLVPNDPRTRPPQVKQYPAGLPRTSLPRSLPRPGISATAALAGRPARPQPLDAAQLGRVLFLGAGVIRTAQVDGQRTLLRSAGSAGARFPLELYVSSRAVVGVPDGVHWYDPVGHALAQVGPPAAAAATTLVVTGVPWRTGWRYAERGWRHLYWDAGTLLSQLSAAAATAGLGPRLWTYFPDALVRDLVGADGRHEYPLALLALGERPPATQAAGPTVSGVLPGHEFRLCTDAQRAGERDTLGDPWPEPPPLADAPESPPLDEVIRARGSQRRMDPGAVLPRRLLDWPVRAALRGTRVSHWVVAHAVGDLAPGVYRWPDLNAPARPGALRTELLRICLRQSLAADASYVMVAAAPSAALDDRSYRDAQLAAGLAEGRLHLAAYALGATASGMTFLDSEMPALLSEHDDLVTLLLTCVGTGEYVARPGGDPGAPVDVTPVMPRMG